MFGLTSLGTFHTAVSLIAVAAGVIALARYKKIAPDTRPGWVYLWTTVVVCLTGFGIFQHGGFGKAHVLGILTLLVLGLAAVARRFRLFGWASPYVEVVSYSTTFFFHMIPGVTETATRLPLSAPLVSSPDSPALQAVIGTLGTIWLIGVLLQVQWLRRQSRTGAARAHIGVGIAS